MYISAWINRWQYNINSDQIKSNRTIGFSRYILLGFGPVPGICAGWLIIFWTHDLRGPTLLVLPALQYRVDWQASEVLQLENADGAKYFWHLPRISRFVRGLYYKMILSCTTSWWKVRFIPIWLAWPQAKMNSPSVLSSGLLPAASDQMSSPHFPGLEQP